MSDTVRYPAGNTAGRDLINWPTILRSQAESVAGVPPDQEDIIWPVDIALAQIMALAWRVKKWRLNGNVEASITETIISPPVTITSTGTAELEEKEIISRHINGLAATRESDLVSGVFAANTLAYKPLVNGGIGPVDGAPISNWSVASNVGGTATGSTPPDGFGSLSFGILSGFHLFTPATLLFSPPFSGIGRMINATGFANAGMLLDVTFNREPDEDLSGTVPGTIILKAPAILTVVPGIAEDFEVPLQLAWRLPAVTPGATLSGSATGEFTLEAIEFWPFADSSGNPVYDTASGTQISDPFG